jgi:hypothetical protein
MASFLGLFRSAPTQTTEDKFQEVLAYVTKIYSDPQAQKAASKFNLRIMRTAWEDTGRDKNSSVGPNISDMTLGVNGNSMPIIRGDNFVDVSVDMPLDLIPNFVVGNHDGSELRAVSLKDILSEPQAYMTCADKQQSLFLDRDVNILTSAQACLLPLHEGNVPFCVDLYNYQSTIEEPAVLVIIGTAQGTSCQVVSGGKTKLYFNRNGEACDMNAQRITAFRESEGRATTGPMNAKEKAMNAIWIVQVPLVYTERPLRMKSFGGMVKSVSNTVCVMDDGAMDDCAMDDCVLECAPATVKLSANGSYKPKGAERAILTVGASHGKFVGINVNNKPYMLVRDSTLPIRMTAQFYFVTDDKKVDEATMEEIANQIRAVYQRGVNESSLVVDYAVAKPGTVNPAVQRPTAMTSPSSTVKDLPVLIVNSTF